MFLAGEAHGIALEGFFFYYHDLGMTKRPEVFQPPVLVTTNPFLKTDICGYAGSGRRIRTLTNRVRVCRATLTQSRYFFRSLPRKQ